MALIERQSIPTILKETYDKKTSVAPSVFRLEYNPLREDSHGKRQYSVSIEDSVFGDTGKGKMTQETNEMLIKEHTSGVLYSLGPNGARNTGHDIEVKGKSISCHQLPVAVTQEGAIGIISKGKLVHPGDLVTEIEYVKSRLDGRLWGELVIDQNAIVTTDLHSAYEAYTNEVLNVGHGSTGSGVAQGYASFYEKRAVTVRDLMSDNWEKIFRKQFYFYAGLMGGEWRLIPTNVNRLNIDGTRRQQSVGRVAEFLDQLRTARDILRPYVKDVRSLIEPIWRNSTIPFTFEGAQGAGLDPFFGVYPDVTASRPMARISITDATEGVVRFNEIAATIGTIKIPYMSSVGSRKHPYAMEQEQAIDYREANEEFGKSTGRARGIYPIDLVAMKAFHRAAGFSYLAVTHLDSARKDVPIEVVVRYLNKETGKEEPYRPYQWHWDQVQGEVVKLPSWDGKQAANATRIEELPKEARQFLLFLSKTLAPVAFATNGKEQGKIISFLKE